MEIKHKEMKVEDLLRAKANIKMPVRYDNYGQKIFDADNNLILDVRGFGRLQYLIGGAEIQDNIGEYVAECINSCPDELILID